MNKDFYYFFIIIIVLPPSFCNPLLESYTVTWSPIKIYFFNKFFADSYFLYNNFKSMMHYCFAVHGNK